MNTIALVATRFDEPPPWLEFWLLGVKLLNPIVDVLLFSDCIESRADIPNLKVVPMSFAEFVRQASERIGVNVPAKRYNKVYDLRPTFGESLEPWLREYQLWGYTDMDCILGDLNLMSTGDGCQYDAYLVSEKYPMGFLSFFRNCDHINTAWRTAPNAVRCLQRERGTPLDEVWFGKVLDKIGAYQSRRNLHAWPKHLDSAPGQFSDGKITWCGEEFACFHFGHPAGWRDRMTRFEFDPASTSFSIGPDGMVSI